MMSVASAGSTVGFVIVTGAVVPPVVSAIGFAAFWPESTTTLPFCPATCLWMWNRITIVVVGQLLIVRSNWPVAAVILPVVSLVVFSVNVPLPVQDPSASVTAGTSFVVFRSAVKTNLSCGVGAGVAVGVGDGAVAAPPHAATSMAAAARLRMRRIDTSLLCTGLIRTAGAGG